MNMLIRYQTNIRYNASMVNIGQTPDYPDIAMSTTICMINERNKVSVSFGNYTLTPIDENH